MINVIEKPELTPMTAEEAEKFSKLVDPDAPKEPQYEWDEDFQRQIVGLMADHKDFVARIAGIIEPKYFTNEAHKIITRCILGHFGKYGNLPNAISLRNLLKAAVAGKHDEFQCFCLGELNTVNGFYVPGLESTDFYVNEIKRFSKWRALQEAYSKGIAEYRMNPNHEESYQAALTLLDEARNKFTEKPINRRCMTIPELASMPETRYLIDSHIPTDALACIFGAAGSMKTFLALDMALSVATGKPFQGRYDVERGAVVMVNSEGTRGLPKRIRAWATEHGQPLDEIKDFWVIPGEFALTDPAEAGSLLQTLGDIKPSLIVIDTLARNFGGGDENSTQDMNAFIAACDSIRRQTGATVLIVHHCGKDSSKGERGSSALRGACDTILQVATQGDEEKRMFVACDKMKDDTPFAAYILRAVKIENSLILKWAGTVKDEKQAESKTKDDETITKILAAVDAGNDTQSRLAATLDWSQGKVSKAVAKALAAGRLESNSKGKGIVYTCKKN